MLYLQDIIISLQLFWSNNGCILIQPIDQEVGAGTSHYFTLLHNLNKKYYNIFYIQQCRRPDDGRFSINLNRMQQYYQIQVLLKPSPNNIQFKCLESLKNFFITNENYDIKFFFSNWENSTLGAWGIGWEICCNGMEIIQFTYMQQVGGINCNLISGEITYGLERLTMYIQNKNNVWDIIWSSKGLSYKDLFINQENEFCQFNIDLKSNKILIIHFNNYKNIAIKLIKQKLVYPSYHYCLKAANLFNILDSRKIFSINERISYIKQIRRIIKLCCITYVKTI